MKRLAKVDLNTPEHFNEIWKLEDMHYFDRVRMEAFTDYVKDGQIVLDVGAGLCSWGEYLLKNGRKVEVHAIDFSSYAKEQTELREPLIKYTLGNVLSLPWGPETFDVVGAGEVIEHMKDPLELAHEMARVCKPGGLLIVGTVDPMCEQALLRTYPEHLWQFDPQELVEMFSHFGEATYYRVGNYDFVRTRIPL